MCFMSNNLFNEEYYKNCCGPIDYKDEHFAKFFGDIADKIVEDLHPKTVLDAGCAMGYLVAALRDRGVEAWGIDISEYAISNVREDIKPYCVVGSLTEKLPSSLPEKFDLVITIEVIEHMYEEDGKRAIKNLCSLADRIVFSSSADDYDEYTHYNVQQREYWAYAFAEQGFFDDLSYRPQYITPWCIYFQKKNDWNHIVRVYEHHIRITESKIGMLEREMLALRTSNEKLKKEYDEEKARCNEILKSTSWIITKPLRFIGRIFH